MIIDLINELLGATIGGVAKKLWWIRKIHRFKKVYDAGLRDPGMIR